MVVHMMWSIGQGRQKKNGFGDVLAQQLIFLLLITKTDEIILPHKRWNINISRSLWLLLCFVCFTWAQCGDDFLLFNVAFDMMWQKCSTVTVFFFLYYCCRWGCSSMSLKGLGLVVYNPGLSHLNAYLVFQTINAYDKKRMCHWWPNIQIFYIFFTEAEANTALSTQGIKYHLQIVLRSAQMR